MKEREVVERLKAAGWKEAPPGGKHSIMMVSPDGTIKIPIPSHKGKDIKTGTLKKIEKETGVKMK